MASRRKSSDEQAVNMDSLMDALTNVVAVLILILILLQVDVGKTVEKLLGELPPATPEMIAKAKADLKKVQDEVARKKALMAAPAPTTEKIAALKADLALLDKSIEESKVKLVEREKLLKMEDEQRKIADAEQKKTTAILDEIRKLEALLDETPVPVVPDATVVRIPDSRDIPEGASIYYCYVRANGVSLLDPITSKRRVMQEIDVVKNRFVHQTIKLRGKPDRVIYDQVKVAEYLATRELAVRGQKIAVSRNPRANYMTFTVEIDPEKGDVGKEELEKPNGPFQAMMATLRTFPGAVLIFKVHPEGLGTYIKAREIADAARIPCGWEMEWGTKYTERLPFEVNVLEKPPPPKPGDAPPPKKPPPPKRKLD